MDKLVSIIIPVYNAANYIYECLNSIQNQDYSRIEIIVIDDGSTDSTRDIITRYFQQVKVISQNNSGPSVARNTGIKESNGEFICFVDADDLISSNMVSSLVNGIKNNKADFSICGIYMFNDQKKITKHVQVSKNNRVIRGNENLFEELYPFFNTYKINAPFGRIYKKDILIRNSIKFDEKLSLGEDSVFNMDYFSVIDSCYFIKDELYGYRRGNNYLTGKYSGAFKDNKKRRFEQMKNVLVKKGAEERFLNGQLIYIAYSYLLELPDRLKEKNRAQKREIICEVISDPDIQNALNNFSGSFTMKVLALFLKTGNPQFIYFTLRVINMIRSIVKRGI